MEMPRLTGSPFFLLFAASLRTKVMRFNNSTINVYNSLPQTKQKKNVVKKNLFGTHKYHRDWEERINFILIALNRTHKPHQTIHYTPKKKKNRNRKKQSFMFFFLSTHHLKRKPLCKIYTTAALLCMSFSSVFYKKKINKKHKKNVPLIKHTTSSTL